MPLLQWAEPTEVLGLARLRGPADMALSSHNKNREGLLPVGAGGLLAKSGRPAAGGRRWSLRGVSPVNGELNSR
jgi:hypothetical protein